MFKSSLCLATMCLLSACASTNTEDTKTVYNEMPEYRTGSIIARKKTPVADPVKNMPVEELEKFRENSSIPMH